MTRRKRNWQPNAYYHVVMRGNNREKIFATDEDQLNLRRAIEYTYVKYPFTLHAYCIMTNHYHLLIRSGTDLSKVMASINRKYSDYYAKRYGHVGRIYEKRYYASYADGPEALLIVSSYIHRNPIDTAIPMVQNLADYPYSSFPFYANETKQPPPFLNTDLLPTLLPNPFAKTKQAYCQYCLIYKHVVEEG